MSTSVLVDVVKVGILMGTYVYEGEWYEGDKDGYGVEDDGPGYGGEFDDGTQFQHFGVRDGVERVSIRCRVPAATPSASSRDRKKYPPSTNVSIPNLSNHNPA